VQFWYDADEADKTVSVELMWNGRFVIDDNYGTTGPFWRRLDVCFISFV